MKRNKKDTYKVVCLFARDCGVKALEGLLNDKRLTIAGLLVHSRLPKSEDPGRSIRPEFQVLKDIACKHSIPLSVIDTKEEAGNLQFLRTMSSFDFLISLSWRHLIPESVFSKARIASFNVHRGKLPAYAGAEPIKRALENGEEHIVLSVHEMIEKIDAGEIILEKTHPANFDRSKAIGENVERIKKEMLPLYPVALIEAIDKILRRKMPQKLSLGNGIKENSMNKRSGWVFFDLDGTLADSISAMYQSYLDFLGEFGKRGTKEEFEELNGPSLSEIVAALRSRYNFMEDEKLLIDSYKEKISIVYKKQVRSTDGAGAVLKELKNLGYKVMLVTSSDRDIALEFIRGQKWEKYFQDYVFGNEVIKAKPVSEIYDLALKRADIPSGSMVVVEDSCNGIKSARAAGAFVVGLINNQAKEVLLKAGANVTVSHLGEVVSILEARHGRS